MSVKIISKYIGDDIVEITHTPSGNIIKTDLPLDNGGKGRTFSPTDLVASALASCILTIMAKIASKENVDIKGSSIEIEKIMSDKPPRRIVAFRGKIKLPSMDSLKKKKIMSAIKTCPVTKSLHPDIKIEFVEEWTLTLIIIGTKCV